MAPQGSFQPSGQPQPNFAQGPVPTSPFPPTPAGTVFPGMNQKQNVNAPVKADDNHKPIVGFLYSVSRTVVGEYWPLYLGQNSIGRGLGSSIALAEQTVSDNHCKIIAQEMKNPDHLFVYIQEGGSTCGTMVNGSSLDFNPREIKNGDIITVGEHYELLVILIYSKQLVLKQNEDFKEVQIQNPNPGPVVAGGFIPPMGQPGPRPTSHVGGFQPATAPTDNTPYPGTVIDNGSAW